MLSSASAIKFEGHARRYQKKKKKIQKLFPYNFSSQIAWKLFKFASCRMLNKNVWLGKFKAGTLLRLFSWRLCHRFRCRCFFRNFAFALFVDLIEATIDARRNHADAVFENHRWTLSDGPEVRFDSNRQICSVEGKIVGVLQSRKLMTKNSSITRLSTDEKIPSKIHSQTECNLKWPFDRQRKFAHSSIHLIAAEWSWCYLWWHLARYSSTVSPRQSHSSSH